MKYPQLALPIFTITTVVKSELQLDYNLNFAPRGFMSTGISIWAGNVPAGDLIRAFNGHLKHRTSGKYASYTQGQKYASRPQVFDRMINFMNHYGTLRGSFQIQPGPRVQILGEK